MSVKLKLCFSPEKVTRQISENQTDRQKTL